MGKIIKRLDIDLNALEDTMEDVGDICINGSVFAAAAAFVVADERAGECYSGTLIYIPGVAMEDVFTKTPSQEEIRYYENLAKESVS